MTTHFWRCPVGFVGTWRWPWPRLGGLCRQSRVVTHHWNSVTSLVTLKLLFLNVTRDRSSITFPEDESSAVTFVIAFCGLSRIKIPLNEYSLVIPRTFQTMCSDISSAIFASCLLYSLWAIKMGGVCYFFSICESI